MRQARSDVNAVVKDWRERKVVIVGVARQGLALARYLALHGARVTMNDQLPAEKLVAARQSLADLIYAGVPVEWVCGGHPLSLLDGIDLLCISGGVSADLPLVAEARRLGIPVSNDSQIFLEVAPCETIGITGSAGKTTTTTLVGRIAQAAVEQGRAGTPYRKVWVGGNIGTPLILDVDEMHPNDLAVIELSSFQLEIMTRSTGVAAVLNITPNHLDRHGTMEVYTAAKARILEYQRKGDAAVLGRDDPGAWSLLPKVKGRVLSFGFTDLAPGQAGTFLIDDAIYLRRPNHADTFIMKREHISLRGEHNLLNVMAACAIAAAAGLPVEAMQAGVSGFTGVSHRLEFVRSWHGADWYNDSIATAPERTIAAILSFQESLVLLAGGRDKKLPWGDFAELVHRRVDHLVLFGEASGVILDALALRGDERFTVTRCAGLHEAVQAAAQVAQPGDVVLLSPGGTSFDEFKDFEERGECFARWVKDLN